MGIAFFCSRFALKPSAIGAWKDLTCQDRQDEFMKPGRELAARKQRDNQTASGLQAQARLRVANKRS
jgi:hypothetical protein